MTTTNASILIVDDDEVLRGRLSEFLESRYSCVSAASVDQAMNLLRSGSFNLVLSAIKFPAATGLDLCRLVQENFPRTVVIMMPAVGEVEHAIEGMGQGAFDYIAKPFDFTHVSLAVDRALRYEQALEHQRCYEEVIEERVRAKTDQLRSANEDLNLMLDSLYRNYRATLQGLARTLEARDIETRGHSDRVVAYSIKLGRKMGLGSNDLIALEQGALLHDIGKVGVPDAVLLKPGALTTEEWVRMRAHVGHGLRIIEGVEFLSGARFVVGQHHEKYDGSGYPRNLRGDGIHIHARIFSVADAFDAIRSDRPYRSSQSHEVACDEIAAHSGSHFDPKVVSAFLSISKDEWESVRLGARSEQAEHVIDRREISSFILSLQSPEKVTRTLKALCA